MIDPSLQKISDNVIGRGHHLTILDKHPRRVTNVLIVEDDVDSALPVENTFRQFGCNIEFARDASEATRKLSSGKADLIILDWMLDHHISADAVIAAAMGRIEKFMTAGERRQARKAKIVTYSSRTSDDIQLPLSPFYVHLDHWHKPLKYSDLTRRILKLMNRIGY